MYQFIGGRIVEHSPRSPKGNDIELLFDRVRQESESITGGTSIERKADRDSPLD
jgi:hypothetical protein